MISVVVYTQGFPSAQTQGTSTVAVDYEQAVGFERYGEPGVGGMGSAGDATLCCVPSSSVVLRPQPSGQTAQRVVHAPVGLTSYQTLTVVEEGRNGDIWTMTAPATGESAYVYFQFQGSGSYYRLLLTTPPPPPPPRVRAGRVGFYSKGLSS